MSNGYAAVQQQARWAKLRVPIAGSNRLCERSARHPAQLPARRGSEPRWAIGLGQDERELARRVTWLARRRLLEWDDAQLTPSSRWSLAHAAPRCSWCSRSSSYTRIGETWTLQQGFAGSLLSAADFNRDGLLDLELKRGDSVELQLGVSAGGFEPGGTKS